MSLKSPSLHAPQSKLLCASHSGDTNIHRLFHNDRKDHKDHNTSTDKSIAIGLQAPEGVATIIMMQSVSIISVCLLLSSLNEVNSLLGFPTATFSRTSYNPQMVATMVPPSIVQHPTQNSVPVAAEISTIRELLPWSKSINPERDLSYMPMFQTQLDLMRSMGMEEVSLSESLVVRHSSVKPARIGNACFKNDKFRKVRLTYFDAGDNVQVFCATSDFCIDIDHS